MEYVYWVIPGSLGGRKGPNQEPWDLADFRRQGVDWIVSITERMLNRSHEVVAFGINHLCVPLPNNAPPLPGDADDIFYVVPLLEGFISAQLPGSKILVHCSSGKDRTPLLMSYFLMKNQHMTATQAMDTMKSIVPGAFTAEGWHEMALSILSRYNAAGKG